MRHLERFLPLKRPYDHYYYDAADNADQLARANKELRRRGDEWHYVGQGTKVIDNGIYFPIEDPASPIAVDYVSGSNENPAIYNEYLHDVREKLRKMSYGDDNLLFLPRAVYRTVWERMNRPARLQPEVHKSQPLLLSEAMKNGGSYLEATIAGAALLDIMTPGTYTSVETIMRFNQDNVEDTEIRRAIRYEDPRSRGERITVIDFRDGICDKIENTLNKGGWDYQRPEDKRRFEPLTVPISTSRWVVTSLADYISKKRERETAPDVD